MRTRTCSFVPVAAAVCWGVKVKPRSHVIKFKFISYAWYKIQSGHGTSCILYMVRTLEIQVDTKKGSKANHKKTFTKIFSLEIFVFKPRFRPVTARLAPSSNHFQQQLRPSDEDDLHRAQKQRSRVPPAGCTLSMTFIWNFTVPDSETSLFLWQAPHTSLLPYRLALTSVFSWFIRTSKTIPKRKSCHFYSSCSHVSVSSERHR